MEPQTDQLKNMGFEKERMGATNRRGTRTDPLQRCCALTAMLHRVSTHFERWHAITGTTTNMHSKRMGATNRLRTNPDPIQRCTFLKPLLLTCNQCQSKCRFNGSDIIQNVHPICAG